MSGLISRMKKRIFVSDKICGMKQMKKTFEFSRIFDHLGGDSEVVELS